MNPPVSGSPASSGGRPGGQSAPSAGLEVTIAHIGLTPEDHLKQDRLDPGGVHGLDLLRSGPALGQERPQGGGDRHQQGENMAQRDVVGGVGPVGPVLLGAGVPQAALVLVVEPGLVVGGPGGIEDPLSEAAPHGGQVVLVGLALGVAEGGQQVRVGPDEPVPDVQDLLDLGGEHRAGAAQGGQVVVAEQQGRLEQLQVLEADRGAVHGGGPVGVAGDVGLGHGSLLGVVGARKACQVRSAWSAGAVRWSGQSRRSSPSPKGASTKAQWCGVAGSSCWNGWKNWQDTHIRATGIRPLTWRVRIMVTSPRRKAACSSPESSSTASSRKSGQAAAAAASRAPAAVSWTTTTRPSPASAALVTSPLRARAPTLSDVVAAVTPSCPASWPSRSPSGLARSRASTCPWVGVSPRPPASAQACCLRASPTLASPVVTRLSSGWSGGRGS